MTVSTDVLAQQVKQLSSNVNALSKEITDLKENINGRTTLADLSRSEANIRSELKVVSTLVNKMEEKLSQVVLPADTRYYLDEADVSSFRSNFAKLLAMISDFEALYKNLVAYSISSNSSQ